jgi:hypothetical protein
MSTGVPPSSRVEKSVEWISAGDFAVAVDVELVYPPDAPHEPCFRPETIRRLEHLRHCAERGQIAELERAGRVYRRVAPTVDGGIPTT